jgi:hypothetical protein
MKGGKNNKKDDCNIITLNELKLLWEKLFYRISESIEEEIILDGFDMYWSVGAPECYNMKEEPSLVVGSLKDDLIELKKLLESNDRPIAFINLERFAAVLNAISQKLNPI